MEILYFIYTWWYLLENSDFAIMIENNSLFANSVNIMGSTKIDEHSLDGLETITPNYNKSISSLSQSSSNTYEIDKINNSNHKYDEIYQQMVLLFETIDKMLERRLPLHISICIKHTGYIASEFKSIYMPLFDQIFS